MIQPAKGIEVTKLNKHLVWHDEDGIVYIKSIAGEKSEIKDIQQLRDFLINLSQEKRSCILIDFSNVSQADRETRDYVNKEFPKIARAVALVSKNPLGRMMANLFFNLKKQPFPTKMFDKELDAKEWLKQYL